MTGFGSRGPGKTIIRTGDAQVVRGLGLVVVDRALLAFVHPLLVAGLAVALVVRFEPVALGVAVSVWLRADRHGKVDAATRNRLHTIRIGRSRRELSKALCNSFIELD